MNNTLTYEYRLLDKECALICDLCRSARQYENKLFVPDLEGKERLFNELNRLEDKINAIEAPDAVFEIIKEQMGNFIQAQKFNAISLFERPSKHINAIIYAFSTFGRKDSRHGEKRAGILIEKYSQTQAVWSGVKSWLSQVSPLYLQELITAIDTLDRTMTFEISKLGETFDDLQASLPLRNQLQEAMEGVIREAKGWKEHTKALLAQKNYTPQAQAEDNDTIKFEENYYRQLLKSELGINLDELLSWYEAEVEKTRAEVFAIVDGLDIPDEKPKSMEGVNNLLLKYAGPYENPEKTFQKAQEYLDIAAAEARRIVPMPEETCKLCPIPEQIKYSYPWGGYGGGCPNRRPLIGEYYVNDFNYTAVTDGWLKMMAIHEAYPGHHVQFIRTTVDTLPEVCKIGAQSIPITEGTAHRSERVFEYLFPDDQFYPLFVAYRRHHTSVRIKAELGLRVFGKTIGEAVDLYVNELGFDRKTARGQVAAQESMQGYFNSYYYGMKKIEDFEKKFQFESEEYTRYLFDAGRISIELFEKFLALSVQDKERYRKDFASLLPSAEEF